jgi:hypothetical protein
MKITDFDKVRNYKISRTENVFLKQMFQEYIDANSCFEDYSSPEIEGHFETFKHAWIMANIIMEND